MLQHSNCICNVSKGRRTPSASVLNDAVLLAASSVFVRVNRLYTQDMHVKAKFDYEKMKRSEHSHQPLSKRKASVKVLCDARSRE